MKTFQKRIGIAMVINLLLITSCVSSKKYTDLQNENKQYKDQIAASEAKSLKLQKFSDSLKNEIGATQAKLNDKVQQELMENMKLDKTEKLLSDLQNAVKLEQNEVSSIRQKVCFALKCFTPDELSIKEKDGELYVSMYDKLLFSTGSAIVNERGKEALKMLADVLKKNDMAITVEGHTDAVPIHNSKYEDNWDLSVERATNVTRLLIQNKITPDRIMAAGRSKYHPFDSNETEKGRKLNRRTDIVIVPKLEQLYSLINQDNKLQLNALSSK